MLNRRLRLLSWVRVSSQDQVFSESPESHIKSAVEWSERNNAEITEWIRLDGISGTESLDHPEAYKMLYLARSGQIDGVLFTSLTRFGRDMVKLVQMHKELEKYNVRMLSIQENIDTSTVYGLDQFYNLARAAEIEIKRLSERIRRGYDGRRRLGQVTSAAPYGFKKVNRKLEINEAEAAIRREMFSLFLEHERFNVVARILNSVGYVTRTGGLWEHNAVKRNLTDPSAVGKYYSGRYRHKRQLKPPEEWVEIPCPQLVTQECFDAVQALIKQSEVKYPARKPHTAYGGILMCSCGTPMYHTSRASGGTHPRYFCRSCSNSIRATDLDQSVGEMLTGFALDALPERVVWQLDTDERAQKLQAIRNEIEQIQKRRARMIQLFQSEALNLADFKAHHAPLVERQEILNKERERIEVELSVDDYNQHASQRAAELLSVVPWGKLLPAEKRDLLRVFVREMTLNEDVIEVVPALLPNRLVLGDKFCSYADQQMLVTRSTEFIRLQLRRPDRPISPGGKQAWGYYVVEYRKKLALTREIAARQIGISASALAGWEQGRAVPKACSVPKIVSFLGFVPWERTPYQSTLGASLTAARELCGLLQRELANRAGLSAITVYKIEGGQPAFKATLAKLEQALGVPFCQYLSPGGWLNPA